jgi:N4-gp56 family major capsid protein
MALNVSTGTPGAAAPAAGAFPANHKFYKKNFLEALQPEEVYSDFGEKVSIPPNTSNTIVINKMAELATLESSPLTEGVTPTEQTLSMTRIEASFNQFGGFLRTTDRLNEESINGVTTEFSKRIGWQGGRTMNLVNRDGLLGGTNVRYTGGAANQDAITSSGVVTADFAYMWNAFKQAHVRTFVNGSSGSQNLGTLPVAPAFWCVVPFEARAFLETLDDSLGNKFENVENYQGQVSTYKNEIGRYREFRFIGDTEASIVSNAAGTPQDIAQCLVFGQGQQDKAYHIVDLAGGNMQMITKPLGSSGSLDPLDQRASMGWKAKGGTFITQDLYMFRYEFSIGNT